MVGKQWFVYALKSRSRLSKIINWMYHLLSTKSGMLHYIMHLDPPPDHPKSSIGCIKINCDGWEAMVWVFCRLVAWIMALKWDLASWIFHWPEIKKEPAPYHIMHLDPLPDFPKSSIGCIKINCDGWEAMVWVFCQLVAWIMALKWDLASWIFHRPQHTNQPAASHHALGPPSRPFEIIHWMYQDELWWLGSNGLGLLSIGCMDNGPKVRSCQLNFPRTWD
jgi:hypothetical protein